MTQYTRVYLNAAGDPFCGHTQTTPFLPGFEPIEQENIATHWDFELEDHSDGFIRSRLIWEDMVHAGGPEDKQPPRWKGDARKKMTIKMSRKKGD